MKRISISAAIAAALMSCSAFASPGFHDAGPTLTDDGVTGSRSALSATRNPASSEFAIAPESRFRMGILSSFGFGLEVGPVDNFAEEIEDLIDELDRDDITLSEGNALVGRFNDLLPAIGEDGYVKVHSGLQVPFFPMLVRSGFGVFTLDANLAGQARLALLDAPLTYNPVSEALETASAAYAKAATLSELSLGFSRPVWARDTHRMILGGSVRYVRASLSKQVIALESVDDDEEIEDLVTDAYDANERTSSNVTVDVGAIYSGSSYRIGVTLANLTEPQFNYGELGTGCGAMTGDAQYNCYAAMFFADRIALNETWTLERLATLDGALSFAGGAGSLSASVDLNEVHDPVGDLHQGVNIAVGYQTQTPWLPDVRLGYRKNLVGTELSSASVGLTFFRRVHFDVACGLENTKIDGTSVPRTLGFNLGFEMSY